MRVLILGYGSMGRRHAATADSLGHDLCIYDSRRPRPSDHIPPGTWLGSVNAAHKYAPEAVILATPAATHADLISEWRLARLFVEKPLALSCADFWRPSNGLAVESLAVGYQLRFHPHARRLRNFVARSHGVIQAAFHVACDQETWPGRNYADTLLECSHEIDLARWVFGETVCTSAWQVSSRAWELGLSCGAASVRIYLSTNHRGYERWAAVSAGPHRAVWLWHAPEDISIFRESWQPDQELTGLREQVYHDELAAWLEGSWHGAGATLSDGLAVLRICDHARRLAGQFVVGAEV